MPPMRTARISTALALLFAFTVAPSAHALRIVDYNVLNYPGSTGATRDPRYRTILQPLNADVIVTEEQTSQTGVNEFLSQVLNTLEPGQWSAAPFIDGNDTDAALFYKPSKVQFLRQRAYYPNAANLLRMVHEYTLSPVGYDTTGARIVLCAVHLKASQGFETQRGQECAGLRDSMNNLPPGVYALACGDMNFYFASSEPGYTTMLASQTNNAGRLYDVLPSSGGWHDNASYAPIHTQSPCLSGGSACASGAATGGLDDRFDFFLPTLNLGDGQGMDIVPNSYIPVGNDGQHFNLNITDPPTIPEGAAYASALILASDHLPIRLDLQLPAKMSVDSSAIALGTAIVGAGSPPTAVLTVTNTATPPADGLDLGTTAPAGFNAFPPAAIAPGLSGTVQLVLDASTVGNKSGALTLTSDAPELPVVHVPLSGTVLDHASPSLDSLDTVLSGTLEFGTRDSADFTPGLVAVHDFGWTSLRARLAVNSATITGGAGHFAIADFLPRLVNGTGARWNVSFDPAGATPDSSYEADLTFTTNDETLPGATAEPDLVVHLHAQVNGGSPVAVAEAPPASTVLYAPAPNPLAGTTRVRFDLAGPGRARVDVFDVGGRRIATLADRDFAPGRYSAQWDGRDASGRAAGAGVYYVRLTTAGHSLRTRLAVVR